MNEFDVHRVMTYLRNAYAQGYTRSSVEAWVELLATEDAPGDTAMVAAKRCFESMKFKPSFAEYLEVLRDTVLAWRAVNEPRVRHVTTKAEDPDVADRTTEEGRVQAAAAYDVGVELAAFLETRWQAYGRDSDTKSFVMDRTMDLLYEQEAAKGVGLMEQIEAIHQRVLDGDIPWWHEVPEDHKQARPKRSS